MAFLAPLIGGIASVATAVAPVVGAYQTVSSLFRPAIQQPPTPNAWFRPSVQPMYRRWSSTWFGQPRARVSLPPGTFGLWNGETNGPILHDVVTRADFIMTDLGGGAWH